MTEFYRPTKAVIDLNAIQQNLQIFKERSGKAEIFAVVKADAYGHGMVEVAQKAVESGVNWLAVATPDEALLLMEHKIEANILVMGHSPAAFIPVAQRAGIAVAAISLDWILQAGAVIDPDLPRLKIHLKVDTGMRRVGVQAEEVREAVQLIRRHFFSFEGLFTHFATADEDRNDLFQRQVKTMAAVVEEINDSSVMIHVSNSAAAIMHPELAFDAVRIGISLYGIAPSSYVENNMPITLAPALGLETEIVHIKRVAAGEAISYGATYRCEQDEWIATLPIGYADGMLRGLQGQEVLVRGKRVPIVGRICMDQCMIRLPEKMPVGEQVQLIGSQAGAQIRIEEWAEKLDTIAYEIPVNLTKRVPRIYC
ncbi:alanine racemase [Planomicrobium sp. CPCC 101079]|uniref:alanine racemase n=1 Tax=Planomicrobium sp. CPCC 101079 TaxID=2599618 RepID=UPI0011B3CC9B|nr:alanine racemase [Planomicrobium sp. CPCC 101079]TWT02206.1 alanine racemase [Planomicrobium sp. CPCC 101079]